MRLRIFTAAAMPAALAKARAELGDDALILSTRHTRGGVEVVAAVEPDNDGPVPSPPEAPPNRIVPSRRDELANGITFTPLPLDGALLLVGPPGAGKTLTVARLATRLVIAGQRPTVITADDRRAAAAEQLAAYTRLLGLDLIAVQAAPDGLRRALASPTARATALIDTAGCNPFDPADRRRLIDLAEAAEATVVAVLPAGMDPAECVDLALGLAVAGARLLVATRLDLARRLGGILAAATPVALGGAGLALAEAGTGPGAADGLIPFTPDLLASLTNRIGDRAR